MNDCDWSTSSTAKSNMTKWDIFLICCFRSVLWKFSYCCHNTQWIGETEELLSFSTIILFYMLLSFIRKDEQEWTLQLQITYNITTYSVVLQIFCSFTVLLHKWGTVKQERSCSMSNQYLLPLCLFFILRQFICSTQCDHQSTGGELSDSDMGHSGRRPSHRVCHHPAGIEPVYGQFRIFTCAKQGEITS